MRIVIGIPSGETVHADFAMSLARLVGYSSCIREREIVLVNQKGALVEVNRNLLAEIALRADSDYLAMFDTDMVLPPDALERMLCCKEKAVWYNYSRRDCGDAVCEDSGFAAGCCLIHTDVFQKLEAPWFFTRWKGANYTSEDLVFGERLKDAGIEARCLHSSNVGHIGSQVRYLSTT